MSSSIPSIDALHKEKNVKETSKMEMFNMVLNKCIEKIRYTNKQTDKTFIYFEVPQILIGHPMYDMKSCILYLKGQLSSKDYIVEFLDPFYLYIDWGSRKNTQEKRENFLSLLPSASERLKQQTKQLLDKFPETTKVEFVYDNSDTSKKKKNKKRRK